MVGDPPVELLKTDPMRFWIWTALVYLERGLEGSAREILVYLLAGDPPTRDVRAELCAVWHTAQEEK